MTAVISLLDLQDQQLKAKQVVSAVKGRIKGKNLFGWRTYIEEVTSDVLCYMMKTSFQYSEGAYITLGMQLAIDKCRYCNAKKRRAQYESLSIDECYNVEDNSAHSQRSATELYLSIVQQYGQTLATALKPIIYAEQNKVDSKDILKKVKTAEFKEFLKQCAGY